MIFLEKTYGSALSIKAILNSVSAFQINNQNKSSFLFSEFIQARISEFSPELKIDNGYRDENGNLICCLDELGRVSYPKSVQGFNVNFKGTNNTVIVRTLSADHSSKTRIDISMSYDHTLIIDQIKSGSKLGISFKGRGSFCSIGANSFFSSVNLYLREGKNIFIGRNCLFSTNVSIWNSDSHSILDINGVPYNRAEDVVISDNVFVGQNAHILKGSHISSNSVVGAMSLVTRKFDKEKVIIAGNPARIVSDQIGGWHILAPSEYEKRVKKHS